MMSIFICHASEDKDDVARPLADALVRKGFNVWYDEYSLKLGDSIRRTIERALSTCQYGVVILSKNFFAKQWPQRELNGIVSREISSRQKILLPIWHKVGHSFITKYSPILADRKGVDTSRGLDYVVGEIVKVIGLPISWKEFQDRTYTYHYGRGSAYSYVECPRCGHEIQISSEMRYDLDVYEAACSKCDWEDTFEVEY